MREGRLQLRLDARLKEQATRVVKRRRTSLSAVITQFLQQLVESDAMERHVGTRDHEEQV